MTILKGKPFYLPTLFSGRCEIYKGIICSSGIKEDVQREGMNFWCKNFGILFAGALISMVYLRLRIDCCFVILFDTFENCLSSSYR